MSAKFRSVRGVADILPSDIHLWQRIENNARSMLETFGYTEIRIPIFEYTELFARGIGEETDIVSKEMYTFPDRKGQLLTLRPEGTAPVVRAYLQHKLNLDPKGQKLYYIGPMFRYERPQAGRTRQFHQIGAESFGHIEPEVDAEQIILIYHLFKKFWDSPDSSQKQTIKDTSPFHIHLNTLGCRACKIKYHKKLREYLKDQVRKLCQDCQKRYDINTLRILDCKNPECKNILYDAPKTADVLCPECLRHFSEIQNLLNMADVPYHLNPQLVRGLDYYTRTTFEVTSRLLGAQDAIAGGGRYDHLVEDFGGPHTPAFGFALGMERLILALKESSRDSKRMISSLIFIAALGPEAKSMAFLLTTQLRLKGIPVEMDYDQSHSLKAQMRQADRLGASHTMILGSEEISRGVIIMRQMSTGSQKEYPIDEITNILAGLRD